MRIVNEIVKHLFGTDVGIQSLKEFMSSGLDVSNLLFFKLINDFLNEEIKKFGVSLLESTMTWVGSVALVLMSIWIMIQGYRIVTGQSRDSMAALVTNSAKATLIVAIATGWGMTSSTLFDWVENGIQANINEVVTGSDENVYEKIDESLGYMQLAFSSIDAVQDGDSAKVDEGKSRAMWFTGIGTGGPAITAGVMLLLNKIAMALFIGLGPIFILALLFDQTKQLFSNWLFYGLGTMFSLAMLSVMVALALKVVIAVSISFWVGKLMGGSSEGVNSMAMQQGGLGLLLTMLIISAPPMAAQFFRGVLGHFTPYSGFNSPAGYSTPPKAQQQQTVSNYPPGSPGYGGNPPGNSGQTINPSRDAGGFNNPVVNPYQTATTLTASQVRVPGDSKLGNAGPQQQNTDNMPMLSTVNPMQPTDAGNSPRRGGNV